MPKGSKTKLLWQNPKYRQAMSEAHKGQKAWNKIENWKACRNCGVQFNKPPSLNQIYCNKKCYTIGALKKSPGYSALHKWIHKQKGKAMVCSKNSSHQGRIEWSNISHEYKRDLNDWMSLCLACHKEYDGHGNYWLGKTFSKSHRRNLSLAHQK